jgi:hypothetical protein
VCMAGTHEKKIMQWDLNTGDMVQVGGWRWWGVVAGGGSLLGLQRWLWTGSGCGVWGMPSAAKSCHAQARAPVRSLH